MTKITKQKFIDALENTRGIMRLISKNLEVTHKAVYNFMDKHPELKELREIEAGKTQDLAEAKLHELIAEGNMTAVSIALLKQKRGRARGYGDYHEVEHSTGSKGFAIQLIETSDEEIKKEKNDTNKTNQNKHEAEGSMESTMEQEAY